MRKLAVLTLAVVLVAGVAAPQVAWGMVILLRVGAQGGVIQIEGESTIKGHENEILVDSMSFAVSNPVTGGGAGGGAGTGRARFSDISFVKRVDKASPKLFLAVAMGTHYPHARLSFIDPLKKALVPIFTIDLEDVIFTSFQFSGGGDGLIEQVSLNFTKIVLKHDASGVSASWDVQQNEP